MSIASFDSTKHFVSKMLKDIGKGKTQLPDFQRGWVWDDDHIRDLLASIAQSFPIGAVMTLQTGGTDVSFKPRPIEGIDEALQLQDMEPDTLILDGQQRLTSLFQSLEMGRPVSTKDSKGKKIHRWYYFDMKRCVEYGPEDEEAILSIPEDKKLMRNFGRDIDRDLSTSEQEYANHMFPAHLLFDPGDWRRGYSAFWKHSDNKTILYDKFEEQVIEAFKRYQVPVIKLGKETSKEAVCIVFEKVNSGGVSLTVFELLTASFAADNFQLRENWEVRERSLKNSHPVLHDMDSTLFLQALTLLATQSRERGAVSCKRKDILRLCAAEYNTWADLVQAGFVKAARFLHGQKIFQARDLPYRTQLVPLAAILTELGEAADAEGTNRKLTRWYWCGVLGEMYGGTTETRFANDFLDVTRWVRGETEVARTIQDANFQANRLLTLRTRNSAAYKGIHALLMRDGSRDFRTGEPIEDQTFFDDSIDIHHIFPKNWCRNQGVARNVYNSIVNKTAIAARTNRSIGGRAPSEYLLTLQNNADISETSMNDILASHRICAQALRTDDFSRFFASRAESLLQCIETVMGHPVWREEGLFRLDAPMEDYDDGPKDWDENA